MLSSLSIHEFLPSLIVTTFVASLVFVFRKLIVRAIDSSIQARFDEKLEIIKSDLRVKEKEFEKHLREAENQLEILRTHIFQTTTHRQNEIMTRKILAVDKFWRAFLELKKLSPVSKIMMTVNFEKAAEASGNNPKAREAFEQIYTTYYPEKQPMDKSIFGEAYAQRPFLSPMSWALFYAYQAIVLRDTARLSILRSGAPANILTDDDPKEILMEVFPEIKESIKEYTGDSFYYFLEMIEEKLVQTCRNDLEGDSVDKGDIERAKRIFSYASQTLDNITETSIG